jgi:hypothetical protein
MTQAAQEDTEAWFSMLAQIELLKAENRDCRIARYPFHRRSDGKLVATVRVGDFTERWVWRRSRWTRIIAAYRNR